jgi:hypothetical protein
LWQEALVVVLDLAGGERRRASTTAWSSFRVKI